MWMLWVFSVASVFAALSIAFLLFFVFSYMRWRLLRDFLLLLCVAAPGVLVPGWVVLLGDESVTRFEIVWWSMVSGSYLLGLALLRIFAFRPSRADPEQPRAQTWLTGATAGAMAATSGTWLLLVIVLYALAGAQLDEAHLEAQELFARYSPPELEEPMNAAPILDQVYDQISADQEGLEDIQHGSPDPEDQETWVAMASDFFARHRDSVEVLHQATRYPGCQFEPPGIRTAGSSIQSARLNDLTGILTAEARLALATGEPDRALEIVTCVVDLARQKLHTDTFSAIEFSVGTAFFSMGIELLEETLSHPDLDKDLITHFQIPPIAPGAGFRPLLLRTLELARAGFLETLVEAEETFGQAGIFGVLLYRLLILPGELPAIRGFMTRYLAAVEKGYEQTAAHFGTRVSTGAQPASTLHGLSVHFVSDVVDCNAAAASADALLRLVEAAVAIHRFRAKAGSFPRRLEELVPRDLQQLPVDPFNGEPLRLKVTANGWTLYSVGPDGSDDGGTRLDPSGPQANYDIVFQYPLERPALREE